MTSSRPGRCPLKRPECSLVRAPLQAVASSPDPALQLPPPQPLLLPWGPLPASHLPQSLPDPPLHHPVSLIPSHHLPQGCLYGQLFVVDFKAGHCAKFRDPGCDRCAPHDLLQSRFPQEASGVRGSKMQWLRVQVPWPSLTSPGQSFVQSLCAAGFSFLLREKGSYPALLHRWFQARNELHTPRG